MICPQCRSETPETLDRCIACSAAVRPDADATLASGAPGFAPTDATISASLAAGARSPSQSGSLAGGTFAPDSFFAGRYRIKRMLGAGGMGAVYEAFDQELGVPIALKVIRTEVISDPDAARDYERRFKQELLTARQVSHPNVVRIHDLGDAAGIKYITMSYIEGADLSSILKEGALPLERTKRLALQFLSGLAAAHDVGIAHRDLKPQNLLIDKRDHLYVSDFGLAKSLEPTLAGLTRTGEFLGTPRYISPEQVEGKAADHRGDIYAAGLILYEMVTGDVPFSGPSAMALMLQRVQQRPKSAREKNPNVPEYFDRVIMRCLEKDPDARYQNAHEVLADLRGERSTTGTSVTGTRTISLRVPMLSTKSRIAAAVVAALLVVAFAVPSTRQMILRRQPAPPATSTQPQAVEPIRVAVLPFTAPADDPALTYAAAGIEESLSSKLFQLKSVNVASASSVQSAVRSNLPMDGLARELGVSFIISGVVQGPPDKLEVTVNAEDLVQKRRLWSRAFQGVSADLLTLQDHIFNELMPHLVPSVSLEEKVATLTQPTSNIEAYESYLKGRRAMRDDQDLKNVEAAIGHYEAALKKDPRFALAYAGIADSSIRLYRAKKDRQLAETALSAAQQAQSINDTLPEVHLSLGNVYQAMGRTSEAIVELKRAADLAPSSDDAHRRLGRAYLSSGKPKEAIAAYEKAVLINPYRWVNSAQLGIAHAQLADYDEAVKAFRRVTELAPENAAGFNDLGAVLLQAGRPAEAIPQFQRALQLQSLPDTYSNLAISFAQAGRFPDAVPMFEKAVELEPNDETFVGNLADGYRWAGDKDKATATYDRAISLALKDLQVNPRNARAKGSLALYFAKKGEAAQARKLMADARAIDKSNVDLIYNEAVLCAILSDVDCSLTNVELALKEGYTIALIESDPDLRLVRSDPRYPALKARASTSSSPSAQ